MPLDISKSHTKTEINLSKPYHQGALLIDLKSRSSKNLIDIKPIRKPNFTKTTYTLNRFEEVVEQDSNDRTKLDQKHHKAFTDQIKAPTLDFDKLQEVGKFLNPFLIIDSQQPNREVQDLVVNFDQNATEKKPLSLVNSEVKTKQLGDIKKLKQASNQSFSSLQPKINVAPIHSRLRILAATDQNKSLIKKLKQKPIQSIDNLQPNSHKVDLEKFRTIFSDDDFKNINGAEFFQFKAPLKFDASDIPQFSSQSSFKLVDEKSTRVNLYDLNNELHNSNLRKKIRRNNKLKRYSVSTLFTTLIIIFCTLFLTGNAQWMGKFGEKSVQADKTKNQKIENYDKWIVANNFGKYSAPGEDLDKDGLNNYEEFLIGSMPTNKNSCNTNATDNENLLNLIDPVTCKPIDFDDVGQIQRFKDVLNITPEFIQKHQNKPSPIQNFNFPATEVINSTISVSQSSTSLVTDILPIPNTEINTPATPTFIEASAKIDLPKINVQNTAQSSQSEVVKNPDPAKLKNAVSTTAVQQYIDQYRSYDKYDNQIANPVSADYFIDMSKRYDVPLKYVLALARSESRFGTDQFNQDGSENRIGRHLNMYSIGLDDDGGSITYPSWQAGVDAFGRWYQRFDSQGYSDCAKWRVYNPNGDYCQKIENLANQIENYITN